MIVTCWRRFRRTFSQIGPLLATLLLLAACNRSAATPTPATTVALLPTVTVPAATAPTGILPTVTPSPATTAPAATATFAAISSTPAPTAAPPGSAPGSAAQGEIFTSPRFSYTVVLPCCWVALPTAGTAIESALAELEAESDAPVWGDLGERLRGRDNGAVLELVALLPDAENLALPIAQVTVSALPTFGLTLNDYLAATSSELGAIANTNVLTSYIAPTLGVGGFPASVIEYTAVPSPASDENADQSMAGLQVAFFGLDAGTLIVLTFTTTVARFGELQPEFLHIVRTMTLDDATI